jgi:hypothetical protein
MKFILMTLVVGFSMQVAAQNTENRTITGTFHSLNLAGAVRVEVVLGTPGTITFRALREDMDFSGISTTIKKGVLHIRVEKGAYQDKQYVIVVPVQSLQAIQVSTGARCTVKESIGADQMDVRVGAGGQAWLRVAHKIVNATVSKGGHITLIGTADQLNAKIVTGGTIGAYHCKAKQVEASIKAGGDIFCQPIALLNAKISAGGNIYYYGEPKEILQKISLGGKLNKTEALPEFRED